MKDNRDNFMWRSRLSIDDVTWILSEGIAEDLQGLLKKKLGVVKYNQIYIEEVKRLEPKKDKVGAFDNRVGALED